MAPVKESNPGLDELEQTRRKRRQLALRIGGTSALAAFFVAVLAAAGVTASLDGLWNDLVLRVAGPGQPAASPLIHVPIREPGESGWPVSRLDLTLWVHAVSRYSPRVVAIEAPLHGGDTFFPSYDAQLGSLLDRAGLVALAVVPVSEAGPENWEDWAAPVLPEGVMVPSAVFGGLLPPLPIVRSNALPGAVTLLADPGGVVRRVPLFFKVGGEWMPSFSLLVVAQYWGVYWPATRRDADGRLILCGVDGSVLARLPVDQRGMLLVRLHPLPPGQEVELQTAILASEQMLTDEAPVFNLGLVRGKVALLSRGHGEAGPVYRTAFGPLPSGDVQARMIHALFTGAFLTEVPGWVFWAGFLVSGGIGWGLGHLRGIGLRTGAWGVVMVAFAVTSFVALDGAGWLAPWASWLLAALAASAASALTGKITRAGPESVSSPATTAQS